MIAPDAENHMGTLMYKGAKASVSEWMIYAQGMNSKGGKADQSSWPKERKEDD